MSKSLLQLNKALAASPTEDLAGNPSAKPFYVGLVVVDPVRQLILLGERLEDGFWTGCGGGAEAGETAEEAAIREAYEESNLRLTPHQLETLPPNVCRNGKVCHCFLVQVDSESPDLDIHPHNDPDEEVAEWRWYPLHAALPGKTTDARLQTINHARMRILGLSKGFFAKGSVAEGLFEALLEEEILEKSGKVAKEGSRGGVVVGHRENGDPIYDSEGKESENPHKDAYPGINSPAGPGIYHGTIRKRGEFHYVDVRCSPESDISKLDVPGYKIAAVKSTLRNSKQSLYHVKLRKEP